MRVHVCLRVLFATDSLAPAPCFHRFYTHTHTGNIHTYSLFRRSLAWVLAPITFQMSPGPSSFSSSFELQFNPAFGYLLSPVPDVQSSFVSIPLFCYLLMGGMPSSLVVVSFFLFYPILSSCEHFFEISPLPLQFYYLGLLVPVPRFHFRYCYNFRQFHLFTSLRVLKFFRIILKHV